jgi:hypothetical protein
MFLKLKTATVLSGIGEKFDIHLGFFTTRSEPYFVRKP